MVRVAVFGVGIDLIQVDRLARSLDRWGDHFAKRVFTAGELAACRQRRKQEICLATRFAAKEAFVKALGRGMRSPVVWTDLEVKNNELGKPEICLSPRALAFCRELGICSWHLSLTDDGDYGAAVVVLEC